MQYQAVITKEIKEFKKGQDFETYTEQNIEGVPKYNLIVRDTANDVPF